MQYNHLMDLGFTVVHEESDSEEIPKDIMIAALLRRVAYLLTHPEELNEALGCCDTIEEEES